MTCKGGDGKVVWVLLVQIIWNEFRLLMIKNLGLIFTNVYYDILRLVNLNPDCLEIIVTQSKFTIEFSPIRFHWRDLVVVEGTMTLHMCHSLQITSNTLSKFLSHYFVSLHVLFYLGAIIWMPNLRLFCE